MDYTLYLVTDSTMVPSTSTFLKQVEAAVENGATIVQLREKSISTLDFIERAEKVHEITKRHNIPLIINDRVDVAMAIDAEGVHVGQDDMPVRLVRRLIGPDKILGVSCGNPTETQAVCDEKLADYVGLGTVFPTNTKKVKVPGGIGPIGVRNLLHVLQRHNANSATTAIRCVAIGGINNANAARVLYQAQVPNQRLDGVAVVSCIMANEDAAAATRSLLTTLGSGTAWERHTLTERPPSNRSAQLEQIKARKPLVHHITNNVVKNFSANVCLAIGASPAMSELSGEFDEFAQLDHVALLVNLGTPNAESLEVMRHAFRSYNAAGKPIVFDPVAAGASKARLDASRYLLVGGQVSVIKGNLGEIMAMRQLTSSYAAAEAGTDCALLMRGVDSVVEMSQDEIVKIAQQVAVDFRTVVVVTGTTNYIVDDAGRVETVSGGHPLMGLVTGTGCALGSVIASFLGAGADGSSSAQYNVFECVVGAVVLYNECGRLAGEVSEASGSFMTTFIDQLYKAAHRS